MKLMCGGTYNVCQNVVVINIQKRNRKTIVWAKIVVVKISKFKEYYHMFSFKNTIFFCFVYLFFFRTRQFMCAQNAVFS